MEIEISSLEKVCEFSRGLTYKKTDEVVYSNNAVLRANNITLETGRINFDDVKYISDQIKIPASKKVKKGSLLICTASGSKKHLGKVGLVYKDMEFAFGGFMGMLTPNEKIDSKYLYWLTQSRAYSEFIRGLSDGANINNLRFGQLAKFPVPLLSLPEQKRIVSILDTVFADLEQARAKTEQNLKNARELFDSYLQQVFNQRGKGWVEYELKQVTDLKSGVTVKKELEEEYGDVAYIKVSGMSLKGNENEITTSNMFLNKVSIKNSNILPIGTTIFPKRGGAIATNKKRITAIPLCIDLNTMGVIPNQEIVLPHYIYFYFKTIDLLTISNGTTIPQINNYSFDGLKLSLPNLVVQKEEIEKMRHMEEIVLELTQLYKSKIDALDVLKASILQKAFSGELTATAE